MNADTTFRATVRIKGKWKDPDTTLADNFNAAYKQGMFNEREESKEDKMKKHVLKMRSIR